MERQTNWRSGIKEEVEHMFLGQYNHSIDEKGRLIIPARYREQLDGGAYITRGFSSNLMILTAAHFEIIRSKISQMSITDPKTRSLRYLMFTNAELVQYDKAGRILIPQFLRESVNLNSNVVIVGTGDFLEIWPEAAWAIQNEQLKDAEKNAQRFADLTL